MLADAFFDRNARVVARELVGMVIRHRVQGVWLSVRIIETEAYFLDEKGSHASLGYTHKRRALFMDGGTIYMYYARGGDSMNFSAHGPGNAVLIKSAYPWVDAVSPPDTIAIMQRLNPDARGGDRPVASLCNGQTKLCRSLGLKVPQWDAQAFDPERLFVEDVGETPDRLIQTTRLGIPAGRDEHLLLRFVDPAYTRFCTRNPVRRGQTQPEHYTIVPRQDS